MSLKKILARTMLLAVAGAGAVLPAQKAHAQAAPGAAPGTPPQDGAVSLREVDIRAFIEDVSNATGRTFIIDPRVTGRVTVLSQRTLSQSALLDVFMSTLRVNGFSAVPTANGAYRIIPAEVAAREPLVSAGGGGAESAYVSQVFSLRYADAESVANAVRPMLSERGQATVSRRGNSLVVVDFGSNLGRLRDVITRLDRDTSTFRSLQLRNTSAAEMARVAQTLSAAIGEEGRPLIQAVPVASSNMLVLRGDEATLAQLTPLLQELDTKADFQAGVKVIPLRYAVADEIVPILQQLASSMSTSAAPVAAGAAPEAIGLAAGRRANIAQHRATNSLIISADPETQEALADVVRALDVRRQQILVEAIIVEVTDQTARELGLQYIASGANGDSTMPFLSTSFGASAPNLLALTGAVLLRGNGDGEEESAALSELRRAAVNSLISHNGALLGAGGQRSDGSIFGLILNALAEDRDSNVLSTPSVMTLDNEQASILVGQQIPITTGEAVGNNLENQFRTVTRQDVGVKLEVRPQISDGGAIRLDIRQEVSSIFGQILNDSPDLITNRREVKTVVQVDAGQIIVLGGLIQDDIQNTDQGVPGLRKIPVAGRLFSSQARSNRRTNLMVFLRPTIVNTPDQAAAVTRRQFEELRADQGLDPAVARALEQQMARDVAPAPASPP